MGGARCVRVEWVPAANSVCSLPRLRAGLSHVTEEIEEESVVPSCALELGSQGDFCVGMSAGDIEGEAPQDGEVGWGIVLSIARQVLVEHDIERPMQAIFDGPVCAHDAHDILGAVVLAHQEVALDGIVRAPLARNPGDGSEPGKVVLLRHVCDGCDDGRTSLLAPMCSVHGSGGFLALARRCADRGFGVLQQSSLVLLHRQHIVATAFYDRFGHAAMTVQASAVTTQPLSCRSSISCMAPAASLLFGAKTLASAIRVCAAQAVTMTGGMWP